MIKPANILIIDNTAVAHSILHDLILSLGHTPWLVENGYLAMVKLRKQLPDLVLLDTLVPDIDGYQLLKQMKNDSTLCHLPIIVMSSLEKLENIERCLEIGADDYLTKPFHPRLLKTRISVCLYKKRLYDQEQQNFNQIKNDNISLETRIHQQIREITAAQQGIIFAMAKLAETRDLETGAHIQRVAEYCKIISEKLRLHSNYAAIIDNEFIKNIYAASPLHDIGKVGIPDRILQKPGRLTEEEFEIMKNHTIIGANTLREVYQQHPGNKFLRLGIEIAESHHERWDGSGYPYGLIGENIPLAGRILSVGDVYDAITSRRYYKPAFSHAKSRAIILEGRGKHFDPKIVDAFLAAEEEFLAIRDCYLDS